MRRPMKVMLLPGAFVVIACGGGTTGAVAADATIADTTIADTTTTTVPTATTMAPASSPTTATEAQGVTFVGADGVESVITDTSRIVSLGGDITEIIFELGLGNRVAAVDVTTTFPSDAAELPAIGFGQQLAAEPVLGVQPTLVIGDEMTAPVEAIEQLRGAGVPVVILPTQTTLAGASEKIRQVAQILSEESAGEQLVDRVESEIEAAQDLIDDSQPTPRVAYVYVRGEQLVLLFGQGMATNALITGAGAVDAGAESGIMGAAPMTPEAIVTAAPDIIVLPAAGLAALGGVDAFAALPGIAQTPAGENKAFLAYDEAFFFNLGPRVGQALERFIVDLYQAG